MTINLSTTLNSSKQSKVYQIAIQLNQYSSQQNLYNNKKLTNLINHTTNSTYRLPKIVDVDEDQLSSRRKSPFKNIFNNIEKDNQMKVDDLTNDNTKAYDIVGRKEVKAYLTKLVKKRNAYQRRNQSTLSLSRYSSSVKSQNNQNNMYLNKQDVLSFIKPVNGNNDHSQTQNFTMTRDEQMLTFGSCKSSNQDLYSLRKSKDVYENYAKTWDKEKMKKLKFPSILDHITNYRSKVEYLQNNSLVQQKQHTKNKVWQQTLRTQKNVKNYYNDKYVEKIINQENKIMNFSLKGKDKLKKQMQWIDEKDKAGYNFVFLDGFSSKVQMGGNAKCERDSKIMTAKEERTGESRVSKLMGRDVSSVEKVKQDSRVKFMMRNQSMCDIKGLLKPTSHLSKMSKPKNTTQSTVLSHFSNPISSQLKTRPIFNTSDQSQKPMSKLRL